MPSLTKKFKIIARDFTRAGEVSVQVRSLLKNIGFDSSLIRRVALCAYEAEMNVVMHGGEGFLYLNVEPDEITLSVIDDGPGIVDIELALQEGYSTATYEHREMGFGAGMGLPNIKKSADFFHMQSGEGEGTHLKIGFKAGNGIAFKS